VFREFGVRRGDRVGWLGQNHPAFLESLFAAAKIGAVLTPIDHRLPRPAVDAILETVKPRMVIGDGLDEHVIEAAADDPIDEVVAEDDVCLLPFTSGTTGLPKGVMLTHGNLTWNVINGLSVIDFSGDDVTIAAVPFFRTGGIGINVLPVLFKGGTVVIPSTRDADELLRLFERHRATIAFGNPDLLERLARSRLWSSIDLTSLRAFLTGGAPAPERLLRMYHARGVTVLQGYGLSEAAPLVSILDSRNAVRKVGSVGRAALHVDMRIVNGDGSDAGAGAIGELFVHGPNVMAGYWARPDQTRRAIDPDGWLHTGDAAYVDADGFLFIVGRMGDAYVVAGEVVHPGLAERVLLQHPAVGEACMIGGTSGSIAYVVPVPDARADVAPELMSWCAERLHSRARPTAIEVVPSLPRNANGKILRDRVSAAATTSSPTM